MDIEILYSKKLDEINEIRKIKINGYEAIALYSGGSYQSVCYGSLEHAFDMLDTYSSLYDILPNLGEVNDVLVLGGGGFSYPKYYIKNYPTKQMDVVELNKEFIDISFKYLYLDKLYELYDSNKERLSIINNEANHYIINTTKKYDGIFIDLFIKNEPIDLIYQESFISRIKQILKKDKFVTINYILLKEEYSKYKIFYQLLKKYFFNVKVITTHYNNSLEDKNIFIIASDSKISIPSNFIYELFDTEE